MAFGSLRDRNKTTVGLVSSAALLALLASVYLIGTEGLLLDRYTVTGVFAETGGLKSGDEVRVAGIRAGEVTAVEPNWDKGRVLVTWEVDAGVDLGPATRADVEVASVLGGRYLRLSGPVTTPHLAEMSDGKRRIPLDRTGTPATVNEVLNRTTETITKLDTESIDKILGEVGQLSADDRGKLGRALTNLADLAETVNESEPQIDKLLTNGDRVLELARTKEDQLSALLDNVGLMMDELAKRRAELSTFLGSGGRTVQSVTRLIDRQQKKLSTIMADLQRTLGTLRPRTGDFNELLAWAGPTLSGLSGVGGRGPWLDVVATGLGPLSPKDLGELAQGLRDSENPPSGGRP